jgi:hypothetical protein
MQDTGSQAVSWISGVLLMKVVLSLTALRHTVFGGKTQFILKLPFYCNRMIFLYRLRGGREGRTANLDDLE